MSYILQTKNSGLGNFINITPIIRAMFIDTGKPVGVYFESEYVRQCYEMSAMIVTLNHKPNYEPTFTTDIYKRSIYKEPDYEYIWNKFYPNSPILPPFIDSPLSVRTTDEYVGLSNGSGNHNNEIYLSKKIIPESELRFLLSLLPDSTIMGIGSIEDGPFLYGIGCEVVGDIRKSITIVRDCKYLITNEGGMHHVASCFRKPTFVMMKGTHPIKNISQNPNAIYSFPVNFAGDIERFLSLYT